MLHRQIDVQKLAVANEFIHGAKTQPCEILTHLFGQELEEVDHEFRFTTEPCAKFRVLRCDADRAGVKVAHPHHDASGDNKRRRGEAIFFRTKHRRNDDVAPGFHLPVDLNDDPVAHAVEHERLLRFGKSKFPGGSSMFERTQRARTGSTVMP